MCTCVTLKTEDFYFGRNLDLEYHYNESVVITPRNFLFRFSDCHYGFIGIATLYDNYPLYYDGTNEKGLSVAGLNFPENAFYGESIPDKINLAPFEFIPWLLSSFDSVENALPSLEKLNLIDTPFSEKFPNSPLHWMISDKHKCVTLEPTKSGVKIYENPIGVLTNNPTFDIQMFNLNNYASLTNSAPDTFFAGKFPINQYSQGLGGLGLPGDLSSMSRFVRAAFTKLNSVCGISEEESVSQFFHILSSVAHARGTVKVGDKDEITIYSSCCNADKGIYYYTTYENQRISCVDMFKENLNSSRIMSYPIIDKQDFLRQN